MDVRKRYWLTDSRLVTGHPAQVLFFAIHGEHHDGHAFIGDLYRRGVRQFVVERASLTGTPDRGTPDRGTPDRGTPDRGTPDRGTPERGTPERRAELANYPGAVFTEVDSSLHHLQSLAAEHRSRFRIPAIGITGSNGKTIVKEWLAQLLSDDFRVVKSPKSYNSQVGVPLSVHELNDSHTLGIFEAGISKPGEMQHLEPIIRPTIGIFTTIGTAHDEGFRSRKQKIAEKLRLFTRAETLIYCADYPDINEEIRLLLKVVNPTLKLIAWSMALKASAVGEPAINASAAGEPVLYQATVDHDRLMLTGLEEPLTLKLPFTDPASVENLIHCIVTLLTLGIRNADGLRQRLNRLRPVSMRLELKEGIDNSVLIDDSYNNDVAGLQLALSFLSQQRARSRRLVILSDVLQSGQREADLYEQVGALMQANDVTQFVGVGPVLSRNRQYFADNSLFYETTDQFMAEFSFAELRDRAILVKGARPFCFERIVNRLQRKVHGTVLEINLDALTHNLNYYRERISRGDGPRGNGPRTAELPVPKIMVMVKAFAYGSGSAEVAQLLQFHRVDYLAVAYADEGVSLRQNGIDMPIMVMNPAPETFATLLAYSLEPEIYSLTRLEQWGGFLEREGERGGQEIGEMDAVAPSSSSSPASSKNSLIHLKIDTGMHRLGFLEQELPAVVRYLTDHPNLRVATVFSHLVGADEAQFNPFSQQQYETFLRSTTILEQGLSYHPLRHLLNSAGIVRFPDYTLDMVRLGIGLYGVEPNKIEQAGVRPVGTLRTVISQIKTVSAGDTVGYSRRGQLDHNARIATLAIGYADGFDRRLGNGVGHVLVAGTRCPTVGNVCMDMTMVDVTATSAQEGDEVIVFGPNISINELAQQMNTIPYEVLTGISERVKRVFVKE